MHSGLMSVTRILINANKKIIKKYNLLKFIGSSRMCQVGEQFKFSKRILPLIVDKPNYVLFISNHFRMTVPIGYSQRFKLSREIVKSKQVLIGFRNNFTFDNNNHFNFNLGSIYDNLCIRLYNTWLNDKYNVNLKIASCKLNPWCFNNFKGASSDVATQIELNNLGDCKIDIKNLDVKNRTDIISEEIKLLQDLLERHEIMLEHGIERPESASSDFMVSNCNIQFDEALEIDYSDDEYLDLNGINSIVTFNGIFTFSPEVISLDLSKREFLISDILCYIECDDSEWRGNYLVCYWNDIHISTYEHRDNLPGGIQELWWFKQKKSSTRNEMMLYLRERRNRELQNYKRLILRKCKQNRYNEIVKTLDMRVFESPELLSMGIRNPWLKNTIRPSKNDILSMEFKWQDRSFIKYSKEIDKRNKLRYGDFKKNTLKYNQLVDLVEDENGGRNRNKNNKKKRKSSDIIESDDNDEDFNISNMGSNRIPESAPPPMSVGRRVTDEYCYECGHWFAVNEFKDHKCSKFSVMLY